MTMMVRFVLLFVTVIFASQTWSFTTTTNHICSYDISGDFPGYQNLEIGTKNLYYDEKLNFHNPCDSRQLGSAGTMPQKGSFFALLGDFIATKSVDDVIQLPHTDKFGSIISRNPRSLQDEMTLDAAKQGEGIVKFGNLGDEKYRGWDKMELDTISNNGAKTRVHYNKGPDGETADFKFIKHSTDYPYKNP